MAGIEMILTSCTGESQKEATMKIVWFMCLAGAGIRIFLSLLPLSTMIVYVPDDAFYYLKIAQNVSLGKGLTFDGITHTNGFHPLWMFFNIALFKLFPHGLSSPYHSMLLLCSFFNLATSFFLYRLLRLYTKEALMALLGLYLWLFNPYVILISLSGLEVSLAVFFISVVLYVYCLSLKSGLTWRVSFLLGILIGLGVLSRTDFGFFALIIGIHSLWRLFAFEKSLVYFYKITLMVVVSVVVASPWFIWSIINFGTIQQDSAITIVGFVTASFIPSWINYLGLAKKIFFRKYIAFMCLRVYAISFFLGVILFDRGRLKNFIQRYQLPLCLGLTYILVHFVFYVIYFKHNQNWYYLSVIFFLTIFLVAFFGVYYSILLNRFQVSRFKIFLFIYVVITVLFLNDAFRLKQKPFYEQQKIQISQAQMLNELYQAKTVDPETVFGSFNTGIKGYLTKFTFINLDGVVNHEVYYYLSNKQLKNYLLKRNIKYFAGDKEMIVRAGIKEDELILSQKVPMFFILKNTSE